MKLPFWRLWNYLPAIFIGFVFLLVIRELLWHSKLNEILKELRAIGRKLDGLAGVKEKRSPE